MPQVRQSPLDATVTPAGVLLGHAHDQLLDLLGDTRSAKRSSRLAPVKLLGEQSLVPAYEAVGSRDGRNRFETFAAEGMGQRGETATFDVRQAQSAATEPGFEDAIFL
jgi:hypothetical protein